VIEWRVTRVAETGSTNADVAAAARDGALEGLVLVAAHQTAGRGRLGRSWEAPPGTGLALSMLLRPGSVPPQRWPWLPLLVGVVVVEALGSYIGADVAVKWPNDVLLDGSKVAGILVERVDTAAGPAAVVGIGLNISAAPPGATSLVAAGHAEASRDGVLDAVLTGFGDRYEAWQRGAGDPAPWLAHAYRAVCDTLGREVRAELPGRDPVEGRAIDVDEAGRLVVGTPSGTVAVGAGEIIHLRSATSHDHEGKGGLEHP
jgi:BirA family transcriptional regulator, biotin operon repressor / biotin---[acetyl-CoA-carboxylase] ligase